MFTRIVVGTDGSETAAEAVRQAIELAKLAGAQLSIVSAYEPVPKRRVERRAAGRAGRRPVRDRPARGRQPRPRRRRGSGQAGGARGPDPPGRGRPRRGDPQRRRRDRRRPDRRRQQGDDRGAPLPARQRAQQRLPSRSLQRDDRPHDLRLGGAGVSFDGGVGQPDWRRSGRLPALRRGRPGCGRVCRNAVVTRRPAGLRSSRLGLEHAAARIIAATPETWAAAIEVPT